MAARNRGRAAGDEEDDDIEEGGAIGVAKRVGLGLSIVLGAAIALYYPIGMIVLHTIDDNPNYHVEAPPSGASRAVAMAAALVAREVDEHSWVANDPFFLPGSLLDNMGNYQMGIVAALQRFAGELNDQVAKSRGGPGGASGRVDPDLDRAAGLLKYAGTVWILDPGSGATASQTASSESQYRTARKALLAFNDRLVARPALMERRADVLVALLDRIAADLATTAGQIDLHLAERSGNLLDFQVDDVYYGAKGRLYAYSLLLRELGKDFERAIADRDAGKAWNALLAELRAAASLQPWIVMNGAPDSQFLPSHLAAQGFFVLRSRVLLREVTEILRK